MCGHGEHHGRHGHPGWSGPGGYGCCCPVGPADWGPGGRGFRHFPTREEHIAWLEAYLKDLQAEAQAVAERIADLKAAG